MKKLQGKQTVVTDSNKEWDLFYYLTEETSIHTEGILYGIQIEKRNGNEREVQTSGPISYSKSIVQQVIQKLIQHKITPVVMLEVIDDMGPMQLCDESMVS